MTEQPETAQVAGAWTPDGEVIARPRETALLDAIATIYDPEIPVNIYELGLIYAVEISDSGAVKVEMTLTAPGCPSAQELPVQVREAGEGMPPDAAVGAGSAQQQSRQKCAQVSGVPGDREGLRGGAEPLLEQLQRCHLAQAATAGSRRGLSC